MIHDNKRIVLLFLFASVLFVLFFIGGPNYISVRSFKHFWDTGHIIFFAVTSYLLVRMWPSFSRRPILFQVLYVVFFTLIFGIIIEVLQYGTHRSPDLGDLRRNVVGALVGLFFFYPSRKSIPKPYLSITQCFIIALVLIELSPFARALTDEVIAEREFPLLAGFERSNEVERWHGNTEFIIDSESAIKGKSSLKVTLGTSKYSGVSLKYFPHNWKGYRTLRFSIYNPNSEVLQLTCRINDREHIRTKQSYSDRFNKIFLISGGLNVINIDLKDVVAAPKTRPMDLGDIVGLGIFVTQMKEPRVIRIDDFHLLK